MIWVQHNVYENFKHSLKAGDIELSLDIFRSELSDLLTYHSKSLFNLFDKLQIKHNKKASYEELLDIVLKELKTNEKFIRGISFLIAEGSDALKSKDIAWVTVLQTITKVIKSIAKYFVQFPRKEKLFRLKTLDMLSLKSSVIGDDNRELIKKDNTVLWIIGLVAVGVGGYFIYRYFSKQTEAKLKAESLARMANATMATMGGGGSLGVPIVPANPIPPVANNVIPNATGVNMPTGVPPTQMPILDPAYNVGSDVLLPEIQPVNVGGQGVQINVQPMAQQQPIVPMAQPLITNKI